MGKAAAKRKSKIKRASIRRAAGAPPANVHPLILQADVSREQRSRAAYEVALVPNPYGEVIVNNEPVRHKAVRRVPHFETLYRSKVIDRVLFACLEWYADRAELANSGLIKCGLDVSGGGGAATSHVPINEAAAGARSDLDWARRHIPRDCLQAFDSVMVDGVSFIESARRICANRYVRTSVERQRRVARAQFVKAAEALSVVVLPLIADVSAGRIRA